MEHIIKDLKDKAASIEDALFSLKKGYDGSRFIDSYPEFVLELELRKLRESIAYNESPTAFGDDSQHENERDNKLSFNENE